MCIDGDWFDTECEELERAGTWTDSNFTPGRETRVMHPNE